MRVLVPVTQDRREMAERLRERGARVDEVECIVIAPTSTPQALADAVTRLLDGHYEWLAVTSRNAVITVDRVSREMDRALDAQAFSVATVGAATTAVCEQLGLPVTLTPERADASGLVRAFPDGHGNVLLPLGDLASPVASRGLAAKGWSVETVEAYRTIDGPGLSEEQAIALETGAITVLVLTSASVVRRIAATLAGKSVHPSVTVIAIGETTAAAAQKAGLPRPVIAQVPSHDGILDVLQTMQEESR